MKVYEIQDLNYMVSLYCPGKCVNCNIWKYDRKQITKDELNLDVAVMIIDTDATYRFFKWYITALPYAMDGIISKVGVLGYIIGKLGGLFNIGGLCGATPLAIVGNEVYKKYTMDELLYIANLADTSQVPFTKSIHDIMKKYNTFEITEDILSELEHTPIVLVKNEKIKKLKSTIDILSMSATPIPRSLNMALSQIKQMSIIKIAPFGRQNIKTIISKFSERINGASPRFTCITNRSVIHCMMGWVSLQRSSLAQ